MGGSMVIVTGDELDDLQAWLKAEMRRTGLTCRKLDEALGLGSGTVSSWRRGRTRMPAAQMLRLMRMFGYEVELRRRYEVA